MADKPLAGRTIAVMLANRDGRGRAIAKKSAQRLDKRRIQACIRGFRRPNVHAGSLPEKGLRNPEMP